MSANLFRATLRALLAKQTWSAAGAFATEALTETTVRLLLEQLADLHGNQIPDRDLQPEDLCNAVQVSYSGDLQKDLLAYAESLREVEPADDAIVRTLLARQLLDRATEAIMQSKMAGKLDIAAAEGFVQRAREVHEGGNATGVQNLDDFGLPSEGRDRGKVITLGTPKLDKVFGGGHGEGELIVIASPAKKGKTSMMISIGAKQVQVGNGVLHIGMEVKGAKNARLYENSVVHKRKPDWTDADTLLARERLEAGGGKLWIKDLSHTRTTPAQIEALIRAVERNEGRKVDCVVLDYLQLLVLPGYRPDQSRFAYSEIARQIRAIGNRLKVRFISGWQINREGAQKDTADEFGLAECWDIFAHVDGLIILNQTRAEKATHTMRLTIAAQREDADAERTVVAHVDWGTMTVMDKMKGAGDAVHSAEREVGVPSGAQELHRERREDTRTAGVSNYAPGTQLHQSEGAEV